ncbi:MAG TPA: hypothetical protein QGG47_17080 [Acidobacteriota bacterium]|nr:hypothetical protein [Acidobacteriota bacterium]
MVCRTLRIPMLALVLALPLAAACGTAEEPAVETPEVPVEQPPVAVEEPPMEEPEPPPPAEPELVGNIVLSGDDFEWGEFGAGQPAPYTWTVRVDNDTTATLSIRVSFQFLDDDDQVLKTERTTIRLDPAAGRTIRENSTMPYDDALRVIGFVADYTYDIVTP